MLDEIFKVLNTFRCFFCGILRVFNMPLFFTVFSEGVNTVLVRGCHLEGQLLYISVFFNEFTVLAKPFLPHKALRRSQN